jgi:eukaryotic-like serine/threonine-protein kinase
MNNTSNNDDSQSLSSVQRIDAICDRFELAWIRGERISIDKILEESPTTLRHALARELVAIEMELRRKAGEEPSLAQYAKYSSEEWLQGLRPQVESPNVGLNDATLDVPGTVPTACGVQAGKTLPQNVVRYFGDYELIREIAHGGMGVVYQARQVSLDRIVAVKMILAGALASQQIVERFQREARAAALLDHPGIVPIYEVGVHNDQHFFSMGYIDGESLATKLAAGPMESKEAAALVVQISHAIQYAHERGVIHRDIKPSNILLDRRGVPRVADFGLAKRVDEGTELTGTGQILGTPSYMPPEQAACQVDSIGPESDVYSLGAMLYAMVTGRPPFQAASSVETLRQVIDEEVIPPVQLDRTIPKDLETIILKCLDKSRPRRYSSAQLLREDLERFLDDRPILARPVTSIEKGWRWCRRNPIVAGLSTLVSVLVIGTATLSSIAYLREVDLREKLKDSLELANEETRKTEAARQSEVLAKNLELNAKRKEQAKSRELARTLYNSDLNRIEEFSRDGNVERIDALLRRQVPKDASDEDQRGMEWYYWWKYAHEEQARWELPTSVEKLSLSSDGKTLVAACEGGKAFLWDTVTRTLLPHSLDVNDKHWSSIQFVGKQLRVIGIGWQGRRREWDLASAEITTDQQPITDDRVRESGVRWPAAIAPNGKNIAGVVNEGCLALTSFPMDPNPPLFMLELSNGLAYQHLDNLWTGYRLSGDYQTFSRNEDGSVVRMSDPFKFRKMFANESDQFAPPEEQWGIGVFGLAYSSDGRFVAGGTRDGQIAIYDTQNGRLHCKFAGHTGMVWSVAFSGDGKWLATGDADGRIYIWEVTTQKQLLEFTGHDGAVRTMAFLGNDRLASAGDDTLVRIWDFNSIDTPQVLRGHTARVNTLVANADSTVLFSGGVDRSILVWNLVHEQNEVPLRQSSYLINNLAVSADESRLIAEKGMYGGLHVFDLPQKKHLGVLQNSKGLRSSNRLDLSLSPNGNYAVAWDSHHLHLWETATQKKVGEIKFLELTKVNGNAIPATMSTMTWCTDGHRFAVGHNGSQPMQAQTWLYEASTLRVLRKITSNGYQPSAIAFSQDGEKIVVANSPAPSNGSKLLQLFEVDSGNELASYQDTSGQGERFNSLAWSPDGKWIATECVTGNIKSKLASSVRILNATTLELFETVYQDAQQKPFNFSLGIRFSTDGTQLFVCTDSRRAPITHAWSFSQKKVVNVWEASTIDDNLLMSRETQEVLLMRNGPRVVTVFNRKDPRNRELQILDLQTKDSLGTLSMPGAPIQGLRLSSHASQVEVVTMPQDDVSGGLKDWSLCSLNGEMLHNAKYKIDLSKTVSTPDFGKISPRGLAGMKSGLLDWETLLQKYPEAAKPFTKDPMQINYDSVLQALCQTEDRKYLVTTFDTSRYRNGYSVAWENTGKDGEDYYSPLGCVKLDANLTSHSPNGSNYIAAKGNELRIVDWRLRTNVELGSHKGAVKCVAWGNNGKWVASSDEDGFVSVWDVSTRQPIATMRNHSGPVHSILFTKDGKTLFSAGEDEQIFGCDPLSGEIKLRLSGHKGSVRDLSFHEGKQLLASAGDDGIVRLWRTADREQVASILQPKSEANMAEAKVISQYRDPTEQEEAERVAAIQLLKKGYTLSILANGTVKTVAIETINEEQLLDSLPQDSFHVTGIKAIDKAQDKGEVSNVNSERSDADFELARHFPWLSIVHIERCALTASALHHLQNHPFLRQLIFRETKIQEVDLRWFQASTKLELIDFGQAKIIPDSLTACTAMPMLRSLQLNGSDMQGHHLESLSSLKELRYLGLSRTQITSDGIKHLASLEQLKFLDLSMTRIDDDGCSMLEKLPKLMRVDLYGTDISMNGAISLVATRPFLALAIPENLETDRWEDRALLSGWGDDVSLPGRSGMGKYGDGKHLVHYSFSGSIRRFSAMRSELPDSESFFLAAPALLTEQDLQMFDQLVHLESLAFGTDSFKPSSDQIYRMLKNKALKILRIGCPLNEAAISSVAQIKSLQSLSLSLAGIDEQHLVHLRALPNLKNLTLSKGEMNPVSLTAFCSNVGSLRLTDAKLTGDGLKGLESLPKLTSLDLKLKQHYSLTAIRNWFPNLKVLRIDDTAILESEIAAVADQLGTLQTLEIANAKLTKASIADFGKMTGLKNLVLRKTGLDSKAESELKKMLPNCKVEVKNY